MNAAVERTTETSAMPGPRQNGGGVMIRARGISRTYMKGETSITPLEHLDLDVARGEFVALMGPSGSGKTTLLNLIAGIDRPSEGTLSVAGVELGGMSRGRLAAWRGAHVGFVFQLYHLVAVLTAYENVELPLLLRAMSRRERHRRVSEALDRVGIADRHDHFPRQLSGGQEQRVAIARAIVTDPDLIVADEPTGDLDKEAGAQIMDLLAGLNRDMGKTLVMVTHDPGCAGYAGRRVRLEKGRIVEDGGAGSRSATHEQTPGSSHAEKGGGA